MARKNSLVPDNQGTSNMSDFTFELYTDSAGQWRWRLVHDNGNIIADSGGGYSTKQKAKQSIEAVKTGAGNASTAEMK